MPLFEPRRGAIVMGHFYIKGWLAFLLICGSLLLGLGVGLVLGLKQKYLIDYREIKESQ